MIGNIFLLINAASCLGIALRVMFFKKTAGQHRWLLSAFAYIMVISSFWIFANIITGHYGKAQPAEAVFNLIVFLLLVRTKGNLAKLISTT